MTIQKDQKQSARRDEAHIAPKKPLHPTTNKSQQSPAQDREQGKMENADRQGQAKKSSSDVKSDKTR